MEVKFLLEKGCPSMSPVSSVVDRFYYAVLIPAAFMIARFTAVFAICTL